MKPDLIVYAFSQPNVLRANLEPFLRLYALHKLPVGPALKAMLGRMVFCLDGYEADRRELYTIAEVRRFYGALHRAWPYGLYLCDLNQEDLRIMALCCLRSVSLIQVDGQANGAVAYDRQELDQLLQGDLPPLKDLCKWAELSAGATARRIEAVLAYFQLRFRPTVKA